MNCLASSRSYCGITFTINTALPAAGYNVISPCPITTALPSAGHNVASLSPINTALPAAGHNVASLSLMNRDSLWEMNDAKT